MTIHDRRKACIVKDKKVLWQPFQTWYVDPFLHACLKLTAFEVSLGQIDLLTLSERLPYIEFTPPPTRPLLRP